MTHVVAAFGAGAGHKAVGQELAGGLAVQLLALLLHQVARLLQLSVYFLESKRWHLGYKYYLLHPANHLFFPVLSVL